MPQLLIFGVTLFVATNLDDIFILVALFADPRFRGQHIIAGQYLGIGALVLVSAVAALIALTISPEYVGLLGLAPIAMGSKMLLELWRGKKDEAEEERQLQNASGRNGQVFAVAAVTIANGGDNIAVYTPAFAVSSAIETAVMVAIFAFMTGLWCATAHWLAHHRTIGAPIRRYGYRLLPIVLISLGIWIMLEAGTFALLQDFQTSFQQVDP